MNPDDAYILIADDDPLVLKSIELILRKSGFPLRTCVNGREALDQIRLQKPVLALLDVMMPEMNGLDVCQAIKSDPELEDIPVFLVTARAMAAERQKGLDAGADDYITKPFVNKVLVEKVRVVYEAALAPQN
jgi:CheY-like chemotaxis protein